MDPVRLNPWAGKSIGFIAVAPSPAGSSISPAAPGSVLYNTPGTYEFQVPFGVTEVQVEMYGGGGGGAGASTVGTALPGGGGGGSYASFKLGEPLITYGSELRVNVTTVGGDGGTGTTAQSGRACTVGPGTSSALFALGGGGGRLDASAAPGGGILLAGAFPVIDLVQINGADGVVGTDVAAGAGGTGAGPLGGAGGAGGTAIKGASGVAPGGGGGGTYHSGAASGGNGGGCLVRISWPPA